MPLDPLPGFGGSIDDFGGGATGDSGGSGLFGGLAKNPSQLLGTLALGANALFGNQPTAGEKALQQQAGEAGTVGRTLTAYELTGTLPSGLQAVVDEAKNGAIAKIKGRYAALGLGGSTMEAQAVAHATEASAAMVGELSMKLGQQGLSWSALSSSDFENLITAQRYRDTAFQNALVSFASGLAGGTGKGTSTTDVGAFTF